MDNLNSIIKERRKELGLSTRELAVRSGISQGYISQLEKGIDIRTGKSIRPTVDIINKLAKGLNVTIDYLLEKVDKPDHIYVEPGILGDGKGTSVSLSKQREYAAAIAAGAKENNANDKPLYVKLDRIVKNMPEKEVEQVLNFAKYINMKGKDRLPDDDDDF